MSQGHSSPTPISQFTVLSPHYDELMDIVPYDDWVEYVELLWHVVDHKAHRVLDCACGTGNVSLELAKKGYRVTGVDLSSGMIAAARRKAQLWDKEPQPDFHEGDLSNFILDKKFDSATCLYDSLNYILEPEKLQSAFACIGHHIEPGGVFVFDMNSEYSLSADLFSQRNRDPRKRLHYDWKAHYDEDTRICTVHMNFRHQQRDGSVQMFEEVHRERSYPLAVIQEMLRATGWNLLKTYDAFTLNPIHKRSERWYFVAQR